MAPAAPSSSAHEFEGGIAITPHAATDKRPDRLAAIAAGEIVPAAVHAEGGAESPVLEVDAFSLWYGPKRVLHDISLAVPSADGDR